MKKIILYALLVAGVISSLPASAAPAQFDTVTPPITACKNSSDVEACKKAVTEGMTKAMQLGLFVGTCNMMETQQMEQTSEGFTKKDCAFYRHQVAVLVGREKL